MRRIQARQAEAWSTFVELYSPLVYGWIRGSGLQAQDAADVLQNVFLSVMQGVERFSYEVPGASFRGWLWTITRNAIREFARKRDAQATLVGGTAIQRLLAEQPNSAETPQRDPTDPEAFTNLTHRALRMMRERVEPRVWDAFWRTTMGDESAAEVGQSLGMSTVAVRQAKFRVLCQLRELLADN